MKTYSLNHDFIKEKHLIDKNINEENSEITEEDIANEEIEDEDKSKISKENSENLNDQIKNFEKLLIDTTYIDYEKKFSNDNKCWWPTKLAYGGKKYYLASHSSYASRKTTNNLFYFCTNHRINTINKKFLFGNNKCNRKIEYERKNNKFYLVYPHNDICDKKNIKKYDNTADIQENIENFESFKSTLINFLNKNPLASYNKLKKTAIKLFLKSLCSFN